MTFPIPLDDLITRVKAVQPAGGPLEHLHDAMALGARMDEQADALIGHFVDQARRAGASWSEIGSRMGVSKQAAQQRFVPRWDLADLEAASALFSRFTMRSRRALAASGRIAQRRGAGEVSETDLCGGVLTQREGLAAIIVRGAGVTEKAVRAALDIAYLPRDDTLEASDADPAALHELAFDESARAALQGTLRVVLRFGHNYVGTEHLLLGVLDAGGAAAGALAGLGLTGEAVEAAFHREIERIRQERRAGSA